VRHESALVSPTGRTSGCTTGAASGRGGDDAGTDRTAIRWV
jgi:hypothetical protein